MSDSKLALVTGAAGGIGLGCAEALVEAGWRVALADRDPKVEQAGAGLGGTGTVVDVTDSAAVDAWVGSQENPEALVTSAGICTGALIAETSDEEWKRVIEVNLYGTLWTLRAFARARLAAGGGGAAVLIASNNAFWTCRQMSAYCASKAGVLMLGRTAASELGEHDIRVNVLAPGETETPMTLESLDAGDERAPIVERTPLGRLGRPEDVAGAARMLLSDDASWVTGQLLSADGGISLRGEPDTAPPQ